MKVALIGYGRMGKEIEEALGRRGHKVVLIIDADSQELFTQNNIAGADVAIEFTIPDSALANVSRCLEWGIPVVSGTTGWNDKLEEAKRLCKEKNGTFFYASNFSIGVNIFFRLNEELARIMDRFPAYRVSMEEIHHVHKKDSPSGTAVTLAQGILDNMERKDKWVNHETIQDNELGIVSVREGEVFGIHEVSYGSVADNISIRHEAYDRKGFAEGVVLAAELASTHKGVLSMKDVLGF